MTNKLIDLKGQSFGRWTVLRRDERRRHYSDGTCRTAWICLCVCGTVKPVDAKSLRAGTSKGCITCHTRGWRAKTSSDT